MVLVKGYLCYWYFTSWMIGTLIIESAWHNLQHLLGVLLSLYSSRLMIFRWVLRKGNLWRGGGLRHDRNVAECQEWYNGDSVLLFIGFPVFIYIFRGVDMSFGGLQAHLGGFSKGRLLQSSLNKRYNLQFDREGINRLVL